MEGKRLIQVDFDNTENHSPLNEKTIIIFKGDRNRTAGVRLNEWVKKNLNEITYYLGYDNELYPKFRIETIEIEDEAEPELIVEDYIKELTNKFLVEEQHNGFFKSYFLVKTDFEGEKVEEIMNRYYDRFSGSGVGSLKRALEEAKFTVEYKEVGRVIPENLTNLKLYKGVAGNY